MLKLERVALELFEYKVEEVRSRRSVRGGLSSVWDLYHHLRRQISELGPEERERLEAAERALRHLSEASTQSRKPGPDFQDLVLGGDPEPAQACSARSRESGLSAVAGEGQGAAAYRVTVAEDATELAEQRALKRLASRVWRHETERFVKRLAGGLRAERDRNTARLLFATHRNLHLHLHDGGGEAGTFRVREPLPRLDDPLFSSSDIDSLVELLRETIECALKLADDAGPYSRLEVAVGDELASLREFARKVAVDPYAGSITLLPQKGPSAKQIRVAMSELGKERMRDDERANQRRKLEERLQQVLAHERHQRQLFHQDVARFTALVDAFFDRLARYLPRSVGGEAGPPRLPGGVLFALNPALRAEAGSVHASSVTLRLKGPTRLSVGGLQVSISGAGPEGKLYLGDEEHRVGDELSLRSDRKWLHAFREGEYLHLRVEDEGRSVAARVAEAAVALQIVTSPRSSELLRILSTLAPGSSDDPCEATASSLRALAGYTAQAPDRTAAVRGFVQGASRAAGVELPTEESRLLSDGLQRALTVDAGDLGAILEEVDLGQVGVHTLTGEPLAIEVATFNLTVRQYRSEDSDSQQSLVVMLPGRTVGIFDEYLIESLGDGLLICVRGDQELVVGYRANPPSREVQTP